MQNVINWLADNRQLMFAVLVVSVALLILWAVFALFQKFRGRRVRLFPDRGSGAHYDGKRCKSGELHNSLLWPLIYLWAESGPVIALLFVGLVGAGILGLGVWAVLIQSLPLLLVSIALFGYYIPSVTKVEKATWLLLEIGGGRLKTTMTEGPRLIPERIIKPTPYKATQDPISVEGHADLADGSVQRYKGTISVISDRHIVDSHGRPRYPEATEILKADNGLPDRFKQAIEIVMSWCNGDDLLNRDEAIKFALSAVMRLRFPPHLDPDADLKDGIIAYYDRNKAKVAKLLRHEPVHNATDVELQFAVRVIETGVTFDPDMDLVPAQQAVRKAQLFRKGQQELEEPNEKGGEPRMTPAESRQTMKVLGGAYKGTIVETGGGGAGGGSSDPLGFVAAASLLADRLASEKPKPTSYRDRDEKPKAGSSEGDSDE